MNTWALVENRHVPSLQPSHEALFTIGNGYLATRGTFEESTPGEERSTFIQGLWVTPPGELPLLGAVPDWSRFEMFIDGVHFDLSRPPEGYRRTLDFRSGVLTREVLWRGPETGVFRFRFRRLLSMANPHLASLEVTVAALTEGGALRIETGIDAAINSPFQPAWSPKRWSHPSGRRIRLDAVSIDGRHTLNVEASINGPGVNSVIEEPRRHRWVAEHRLSPGESVTFLKQVIYRASRDRGPRPQMPATTFDQETAASARAWKRRWRNSAMELGGDPDSEMALRYAAFQLIAAAAPNDPEAGIGAKLASGYGYRHHVFWDTDIFVIPYFAVTQPDLARSHLAYRYRGLEGARAKAKKYGREGAFYAWESASDGSEVTPEWGQPPIGPPVRIWTGELQEHITSDVAYAARTYWLWTGDDRFMIDEGVEMFAEGARYWASRIEIDDQGGHITDVIGPDEYHVHVADNFFTNLSAGWQLRTASDLVGWAKRTYPRKWAGMSTRLSLDDSDLARWRSLADDIVLRHSPTGVWEQHRGYFDLTHVDLADFEPRHGGMYGLLTEDRIQRTQILKQADVVMALALFPELCGSPEAHRRNWDFYLPRTDHGSSLSPAAHARVASRLGLDQAAWDLFVRARAIDLEDSMGNGRDGIHAATQGGLLQAALFGFAGLGLGKEGPTVNPRLPERWDYFNFSTSWHGQRRDWEIGRGRKPRHTQTNPKKRKGATK